nr:hypothetical protein [Tanacetum cinerariifolium]
VGGRRGGSSRLHVENPAVRLAPRAVRVLRAHAQGVEAGRHAAQAHREGHARRVGAATREGHRRARAVAGVGIDEVFGRHHRRRRRGG